MPSHRDKPGAANGETETVVPASEQVFSIGKPEISKAKKLRRRRRRQDLYPGSAPVPGAALQRHSRGEGVAAEKVRTKFGRKLAKRREEDARKVEETAARTEILLGQEPGLLTVSDDDEDPEEFTSRITQVRLRKELDAESAEKSFELSLKQFGPYCLDYSRNGRFLALGGRKGHVAALDWKAKRLMCEINVQDSVHDVKFLHTENMLAVAQTRWTYIYDNQGIEIHCLKKVDRVLRMEFLPYHFLLATASEKGFLTWLDVSVGSIVSQFCSRMGRVPIMCQNPANAVLVTGHSKGVVSMWAPSVRSEPVMKILAHRQPVTGVAVERSGTYLATSAVDRTIRIWDLRSGQRCLREFVLPFAAASQLQFSDTKILGATVGGDGVEFYRDACTRSVEYPYMRHRVHRKVAGFRFAPFEDVVGLGHSEGFESIVVPGSGEANFDALEANPFQTKKQRQEAEVKALLEKIPADLITLNENQVAEIDTDALEEKLAERHKKRSLKPVKIDFEPRKKAKGKGGTAKKFHIKRTVQEEARRKQIKELAAARNLDEREGKKRKEKVKSDNILSRLI